MVVVVVGWRRRQRDRSVQSASVRLDDDGRCRHDGAEGGDVSGVVMASTLRWTGDAFSAKEDDADDGENG